MPSKVTRLNASPPTLVAWARERRYHAPAIDTGTTSTGPQTSYANAPRLTGRAIQRSLVDEWLYQWSTFGIG